MPRPDWDYEIPEHTSPQDRMIHEAFKTNMVGITGVSRDTGEPVYDKVKAAGFAAIRDANLNAEPVYDKVKAAGFAAIRDANLNAGK